MPLYVYKCNKCAERRELYRRVEDRDVLVLCECGATMLRDYAQEHPPVHCWKPGWWEDLDTHPIWIESKQQLFEECEKRGLLPYGIDRTPKPVERR
jgi:putative FmdB family regulatory protein